MNDNLESDVAAQFDLEEDPLAEYNEGMQDIDGDVFEHHFREYIDTKDIKESTKSHYKRSYRDWCEFMSEYDRHPTLPNDDHVEEFVDRCLERMDGGSCRDKLNQIEGVYEWAQRSQKFPHPSGYNPFTVVINKREADLKETPPDDYPKLDLDDVREKVENIKHIGERAVTVFHLKTGIRSTELANIRFKDIHLTNADVMSHYDDMGTHDQLDDVSNAVYIPPEDVRDGNKREMPTVIPIDEETRRVLIDWLLIRPDDGDPHVFLAQKGKPMKRNSLRHVWTKHWHPEYKFNEEDEYRSISPHYARHWFSSWFRKQAHMPELWVQYLRGDKTGPEIGRSRLAIHRYVHTYYEDVEEMYRERIFKLGI